jgi:predicted lipoprotein with Yx(FWY)xxD motif
MRENRERIRTSRYVILAIIAASAMLAGACSATGAGPSGPAESATVPPSPSAAPATASASAAASAPSSGGGRGDYDYGEPSTEATEAPAASTAPDAASIGVAIATGPLGTYLTGPDGLTLYTFAPDSPNTSTCDGGCAEAWPPFTVEASVEFAPGDGVDGDLTTFPRADGTLQVAYDGAPLYYFASDTTPGDTNGQGLGDNWFVAEP